MAESRARLFLRTVPRRGVRGGVWADRHPGARHHRLPAADQDVACGVTLRRAGAIGTFGVTGDGNDVITTGAEMTAVLGIGGGLVKVVTSISACGGMINNSFIGCARPGSIVSESGL